MGKPDFLYHGSKVDVDILIPHKAYGLPEELGTEYGVYALESFEMARRFALPIKPLPNGTMAIYFDDSTGKVTIKAGILDRDSFGYVYKIPSDTFAKLDDHQWISSANICCHSLKANDVRCSCWRYLSMKMSAPCSGQSIVPRQIKIP